MSKLPIWFAATSALVFALSACSHIEYTYTPPTTMEGKKCLVTCGEKRDFCRIDAERVVEAENARCELAAEVEYTTCLRYAADRKSCSRALCLSSYPAYAHCDSEYRICYQNCGGKVEAREVH